MCRRCKTTVPPLRAALEQVGVGDTSLVAPLLESEAPIAFTAEFSRKKAKKLWELKLQYHCPLIGTCLTVSELMKLARQAKLIFDDYTDYELHSYFVNEAQQNTQ